MVNDDNDYKLDVYKIDTRTKLDKKKNIYYGNINFIVVLYIINN